MPEETVSAPAASREIGGSGLAAVFHKELADHVNSRRFLILFGLVAVAGLAAIWVAIQTIRGTVEEQGSQYVFLRLFTTTNGTLLPFTSFVSFLGPLVGIALGFDAISGERARRTLSRVLAQPIHRDAVINAKFLAGVAAVAVMLFALGLVVGGLGLELIGIPPTAEEVARILIYLALSVVYVAFWLALGILFSVLFRQAATSALAGIAVWLFFTLFAALLAQFIAAAAYPVQNTPEQVLAASNLQLGLSRLSPSFLYDEATTTILNPTVRALNLVPLEDILGAIPGAPLPLGQSLLLVWPQVVSLIAGTLICFAISYVVFMRQEVRA